MSKYFKRFNSIDADYLRADKHIHSTFSDGEMTILQIAREAEKRNLRQIAIVDHVREGSIYFDKYCEDIMDACQQVGVEILIGFEAKIKNFQGDVDASEDVAKRAQIRVASVHRFPLGRRLYEAGMFDKKVCQEIELELSIAALRNGSFDVLGHPGGMSLRAYGEFPLEFFEEIILECKNADIAFELNSSYCFAVLKDLRRLLKKHDVLVSLGSDAHSVEDIDDFMVMQKTMAGDE